MITTKKITLAFIFVCGLPINSFLFSAASSSQEIATALKGNEKLGKLNALLTKHNPSSPTGKSPGDCARENSTWQTLHELEPCELYNEILATDFSQHKEIERLAHHVFLQHLEKNGYNVFCKLTQAKHDPKKLLVHIFHMNHLPQDQEPAKRLNFPYHLFLKSKTVNNQISDFDPCTQATQREVIQDWFNEKLLEAESNQIRLLIDALAMDSDNDIDAKLNPAEAQNVVWLYKQADFFEFKQILDVCAKNLSRRLDWDEKEGSESLINGIKGSTSPEKILTMAEPFLEPKNLYPWLSTIKKVCMIPELKLLVVASENHYFVYNMHPRKQRLISLPEEGTIRDITYKNSLQIRVSTPCEEHIYIYDISPDDAERTFKASYPKQYQTLYSEKNRLLFVFSVHSPGIHMINANDDKTEPLLVDREISSIELNNAESHALIQYADSKSEVAIYDIQKNDLKILNLPVHSKQSISAYFLGNEHVTIVLDGTCGDKCRYEYDLKNKALTNTSKKRVAMSKKAAASNIVSPRGEYKGDGFYIQAKWHNEARLLQYDAKLYDSQSKETYKLDDGDPRFNVTQIESIARTCNPNTIIFRNHTQIFSYNTETKKTEIIFPKEPLPEDQDPTINKFYYSQKHNLAFFVTNNAIVLHHFGRDVSTVICKTSSYKDILHTGFDSEKSTFIVVTKQEVYLIPLALYSSARFKDLSFDQIRLFNRAAQTLEKKSKYPITTEREREVYDTLDPAIQHTLFVDKYLDNTISEKIQNNPKLLEPIALARKKHSPHIANNDKEIEEDLAFTLKGCATSQLKLFFDALHEYPHTETLSKDLNKQEHEDSALWLFCKAKYYHLDAISSVCIDYLIKNREGPSHLPSDVRRAVKEKMVQKIGPLLQSVAQKTQTNAQTITSKDNLPIKGVICSSGTIDMITYTQKHVYAHNTTKQYQKTLYEAPDGTVIERVEYKETYPHCIIYLGKINADKQHIHICDLEGKGSTLPEYTPDGLNRISYEYNNKYMLIALPQALYQYNLAKKNLSPIPITLDTHEKILSVHYNKQYKRHLIVTTKNIYTVTKSINEKKLNGSNLNTNKVFLNTYSNFYRSQIIISDQGVYLYNFEKNTYQLLPLEYQGSETIIHAIKIGAKHRPIVCTDKDIYFVDIASMHCVPLGIPAHIDPSAIVDSHHGDFISFSKKSLYYFYIPPEDKTLCVQSYDGTLSNQYYTAKLLHIETEKEEEILSAQFLYQNKERMACATTNKRIYFCNVKDPQSYDVIELEKYFGKVQASIYNKRHSTILTHHRHNTIAKIHLGSEPTPSGEVIFESKSSIQKMLVSKKEDRAFIFTSKAIFEYDFSRKALSEMVVRDSHRLPPLVTSCKFKNYDLHNNMFTIDTDSGTYLYEIDTDTWIKSELSGNSEPAQYSSKSNIRAFFKTLGLPTLEETMTGSFPNRKIYVAPVMNTAKKLSFEQLRLIYKAIYLCSKQKADPLTQGEQAIVASSKQISGLTTAYDSGPASSSYSHKQSEQALPYYTSSPASSSSASSSKR